jgi:flagellar basal-body rod modification protein FlgD
VTSPITGLTGGGTPATKGTSITSGATTISASAGQKSLDENAFLKLLVAQLKYQDPSKPMDTNEMMSQTATFTQVEKLTSMLTTQQSLLSAQHMQTAGAMVGRTVTYTAADGTTGTGVVSSAKLTGSEPTLVVGNKDVPLSSVTEVRSTAG